MKKILTALFVALISVNSFSYSYSCFPVMTGKNTLAINPYVYGLHTVSTDLVVSYGITNSFDLWSNVGTLSLYPEFSYDNWWGMARYDLGGSNILALQANHLYSSLQYHNCIENSYAFLQDNAGVTYTYEAPKDVSVWLITSPGVKIGKTGLDVYCDINLSYIINGSFGLFLTPGIGFNFKGNLFSLGIPLGDVTQGIDPIVGLWYFHAFPF